MNCKHDWKYKGKILECSKCRKIDAPNFVKKAFAESIKRNQVERQGYIALAEKWEKEADMLDKKTYEAIDVDEQDQATEDRIKIDVLRECVKQNRMCELCDKLNQNKTANYAYSIIALEGKLELERIKPIRPIKCTNNCISTEKPYLVGWAKKEKVNMTSLYALESTLEKLNGKEVKVTVEWV